MISRRGVPFLCRRRDLTDLRIRRIREHIAAPGHPLISLTTLTTVYLSEIAGGLLKTRYCFHVMLNRWVGAAVLSTRKPFYLCYPSSLPTAQLLLCLTPRKHTAQKTLQVGNRCSYVFRVFLGEKTPDFQVFNENTFS